MSIVIWVVLDVEGPQTRNDNAQEGMVALAKMYGLGQEIGERAYQRFSVIDGIWGDFRQIPQDPAYSSGHTLKVVLPFYKAMGADSKWLYDFARQSLRVVPGIYEVLTRLVWDYNVWMISTSYEWFIRAYCHFVRFPFASANCTSASGFDDVPLDPNDAAMLRDFMREVAAMPVIEYDEKTGVVIPDHQTHYDRITSFIWDRVYNMPVGAFLRDVHPVGQTQKREALEAVCQRFGVPKEKVMYVGDSQTDVQVVEWLRGMGLTMMFNGKGRVCGLSDIMCVGDNALAIEEVVRRFAKLGRDGTIRYYLSRRAAECGGLLASVTPDNIEELHELSVKKRKELRGAAVGELT